MAATTAVLEIKAGKELQEAENELSQLMQAVLLGRAIELVLRSEGEAQLSKAAMAGRLFLELEMFKAKELRQRLENDAPQLGKFVTNGATTIFLDWSGFTCLHNMRSEENNNTIDAFLHDLELEQSNHKTNLKLVSIAESRMKDNLHNELDFSYLLTDGAGDGKLISFKEYRQAFSMGCGTVDTHQQ